MSSPISTSKTKSSIRLNARAPEFVPSTSTTLLSRTSPPSEIWKSISTPESRNDSSESRDEDPTSEFVRLKMQITDLTTHRKPGESRDASFLHSLRRRLDEVQQDYLFDEQQAEAQFRLERDKADAEALQSKLRGDIADTPQPIPERPQHRSPVSQLSPEVADTPHDIFEDDDSPGGLLEILETPATETTADGITITLRDVTLPKHWSGRTPKTLLSEAVHKIDRFAAISYSAVSGASRAKRAAIEIRWNGAKVDYWEMKDVACSDNVQAEQYIATVALHSLTFPTLDGFAIGGNTTAATQTSFRLLPAVFRDLWDEFEKDRRLAHDVLNRNIWAKLRSIVESKVNHDSKVGAFCNYDHTQGSIAL